MVDGRAVNGKAVVEGEVESGGSIGRTSGTRACLKGSDWLARERSINAEEGLPIDGVGLLPIVLPIVPDDARDAQSKGG